ncbi:MAG: tetratricopeptide repeat protein [Treponema sp.]|jgi:Flp pilus assembly protein TadD|nr:tetratricopeptide repeat protein [Treponema sp.]
MTDPACARLLFIEAPDSLIHGLSAALRESAPPAASVSLDAASLEGLRIPIELPEGTETFNAEFLTEEMVLAGMLRTLAALGRGAAADGPWCEGFADVTPEWLDFYRGYVRALRPGIYAEFLEAAVLKARNGDFALALEVLEGLEGLFPGDGGVLLNKAVVLEEKAGALEGRAGGGGEGAAQAADEAAAAAVAAAAAAWEAALALEPPFPLALFNGAWFFLKQGDFSRARDCLARYVPLAEEGDEEKLRKAEALIKEIDRRGLGDLSLTGAYELVRQGQPAEALEQVRAFIEKRPEVWNGWFVLGWALRRLGRWADGAAAFRKALELGCNSPDAQNELAICLMETGDLDGARRALERALAAEPEDVKTISNLGILALRRGNTDEAAAFFRIVLDLAPEDPVARTFFTRR